MSPYVTLSIKWLDWGVKSPHGSPDAAVSATHPRDGSNAENKFHTLRCVTANTILTFNGPFAKLAGS